MPRAKLDLLRAELEQETFEREMLAAEVELMRSVIEQLAAERSSEVAAPDELAGKPAGDQPPRPRDLDEQLLSQIGLSEREVFDLRDRWDRAQLDKLELNDRAARGLAAAAAPPQTTRRAGRSATPGARRDRL